MMPFTDTTYRASAWIDLTDVERTRMSVDYDLRVGLMMAALSFGADPNVKRVSMHIDSIGLEEAVAEQDSAISELMSEALSAFERIRTGDMRPSGSKAAPKDGDSHGDPARPVAPRPPIYRPESIDSDDSAGSDSVGTGDDTVDGQFEDLMKDMTSTKWRSRYRTDAPMMTTPPCGTTPATKRSTTPTSMMMTTIRWRSCAKPDRTQLGDRHLHPRRVPEAARH